MQINQFGTVTNNKNGFLPTRENRIESLDNQTCSDTIQPRFERTKTVVVSKDEK